MPWIVTFEDEFEQEFNALPLAVREASLAAARILVDLGPQLGRPLVDTLKGSKFANMKELRFTAMAVYGERPSHSIPLARDSSDGWQQVRSWNSALLPTVDHQG
jgi:hypothetical protein